MMPACHLARHHLVSLVVSSMARQMNQAAAGLLFVHSARVQDIAESAIPNDSAPGTVLIRESQ